MDSSVTDPPGSVKGLTSVGLREAIGIAVGTMNGESLNSLHTLQIDEAIERHT